MSSIDPNTGKRSLRKVCVHGRALSLTNVPCPPPPLAFRRR
jgi:hypothetical protein